MAEYDIPDDRRYSREDEWASFEDDQITVGVTDYAQKQLGDVVFVELPAVGTAVEKGEPFGVIESVKAVSDLYAPVSGQVVEVNTDLVDHPELVNEDCYGDGWMLTIAVDDRSDYDALLDAAAYRRHVDDRKT
ncbi:MAG TPA: glycine cleavage system protein GcvH [Myxococcota bacterium]|nr:glycine cleavage system protein GcvH [Myxococcota bacterium]